MTKLHTHYDNLKISQNASAEEIRLAYKKLIQKNHPDKFPDPIEKEKAEKVTLLITTAYQILSDSVKKLDHDNWIKKNSKNTSRHFFPEEKSLRRTFAYQRYNKTYYVNKVLAYLEVPNNFHTNKEVFKKCEFLDRSIISSNYQELIQGILYFYENSEASPEDLLYSFKRNSHLFAIMKSNVSVIKKYYRQYKIINNSMMPYFLVKLLIKAIGLKNTLILLEKDFLSADGFLLFIYIVSVINIIGLFIYMFYLR